MKTYVSQTRSSKRWRVDRHQLPEPDENFEVPPDLIRRAEPFFSAAAVYKRLHGREALLARLEGQP